MWQWHGNPLQWHCFHKDKQENDLLDTTSVDCCKVNTLQKSRCFHRYKWQHGSTLGLLAVDARTQDRHSGTRLENPVRKAATTVMDCGIPEIADPDLIALTEESPLTTYKQNISFKCLSEHYKLDGDVCGMNRQTFSAGRVFGGEDAKLGQITWQLPTKQPNRGGASLISDRWAITATHVVVGQETKTLMFYGGMIDGQDQNAIEMETEKIIIHPGYKVESPIQTNYDNDIALVKMSARVPLSINIMPVCLPEKSNGPVMEGKLGTILGFGGTSKYMFCAGDDDKFVDTCKGDTGGPLVIPLLGRGCPETPYRLKGIVSWGPAECGKENFKGYYTKVENYLDWIRETMETN
ncbi:hypothetical protein AOLI_G00048160 [Acnodon oligacanthus]